MITLLLALTAHAEPVELQHQGRLFDSTGTPLSMTAQVDIGLYAGPATEPALWSTGLQSVTFADGYYSVTLGDDDSLDSSWFDGRTLYLGVKLGNDELGSRQAIASVPYAVHSASVLGRVQVATEQTTCVSPGDDGLLRLNGTDLEVCVSNDWRVLTNAALGSLQNPATSCLDIRNNLAGAADGVYWLYTADSGAFKAYCDIAGGGWTLVLMTQGNDYTTFRNDSAEWSATTALNGDVVDPTTDTNMRSLAYAHLPVTEIRMDLVTLGNSVVESVTADSARAVFTGSYRASTKSRTTYLDWLSDVGNSNWDNQPNCNVRGFQSTTSGANCRYGIIMNNENDCASSDSAIGFGCQTNNYSANRWTSAGGHRWSTDVRYTRRGWIWVR